MQVSISPSSHKIAWLHAYAHPTTSIIGLLLGTADADGALRITRVLPLAHRELALAPPIELGLLLAEQFDEQLLGVYSANARLSDTMPNPVVREVAMRIQHQSKHGIILQMRREESLIVFSSSRGEEWEDCGPVEVLQAPKRGELERLAAEQALQPKALGVVDLEDHMDDPKLDWRNERF